MRRAKPPYLYKYQKHTSKLGKQNKCVQLYRCPAHSTPVHLYQLYVYSHIWWSWLIYVHVCACENVGNNSTKPKKEKIIQIFSEMAVP